MSGRGPVGAAEAAEAAGGGGWREVGTAAGARAISGAAGVAAARAAAEAQPMPSARAGSARRGRCLGGPPLQGLLLAAGGSPPTHRHPADSLSDALTIHLPRPSTQVLGLAAIRKNKSWGFAEGRMPEMKRAEFATFS